LLLPLPGCVVVLEDDPHPDRTAKMRNRRLAPGKPPERRTEGDRYRNIQLS
jgi:hypothetical protein